LRGPSIFILIIIYSNWLFFLLLILHQIQENEREKEFPIIIFGTRYYKFLIYAVVHWIVFFSFFLSFFFLKVVSFMLYIQSMVQKKKKTIWQDFFLNTFEFHWNQEKYKILVFFFFFISYGSIDPFSFFLSLSYVLIYILFFNSNCLYFSFENVTLNLRIMMVREFSIVVFGKQRTII
jgi:hypothetical protein